jgi:hypothetical protein
VIQATVSTYLKRHEVVDTELTRQDAIRDEEMRETAKGEGGSPSHPSSRPLPHEG